MKQWLIPAVLSATAVCAIRDRPSAADPDRRDEQLHGVLQRFPEADPNKDGKLTLEEAREFRRTGQAAKPAVAPTDALKAAPAARAATAQAKAQWAGNGRQPKARSPGFTERSRRLRLFT